jgi:HK97 gp10 family phage protein
MAWDLHQLDQLAGDIGKSGVKVAAVMRHGVATTATRVESQARAAVPVDTGTLRNSITVQVSGLSALVEARAPYASFVEYGTVRRPPQPFMVPAAQGAEQALTRAAEAAGVAAFR